MDIQKTFKNMILVFTLLTSTQVLAYSFVGTTPFEPALTADQSVITAKSIEAEGLQLEQITQWFIVAEQVKSKKDARDQRKEDLKTAEKLFKSGAATKDALDTAKFLLDNAEAALKVSTAKQDLAQATGLKFKYIVLNEGNPNSDYRLNIAESIKTIHINNKTILEAELKGSQATFPFLERMVYVAKTLWKSKNTNLSNLRAKESILRSATERLRVLELQIRLEDSALKATEETIKILTP